jgi:Raf kinase inhibitor-like YbhB/YbcL family protein
MSAPRREAVRHQSWSPYDRLPSIPSFSIASQDVADGVPLPPRHLHDGFGLAGENLSPQLSWWGFPADTRGFAVTCFDPDAPTPCGFWHWLLVDLPASTTALPRGAGGDGTTLPEPAFHLRNDFGGDGFSGCAARPGSGTHRYLFAVHALACEVLGVGPDTSAAMASAAITAHTLGRAILTPVYEA